MLPEHRQTADAEYLTLQALATIDAPGFMVLALGGRLRTKPDDRHAPLKPLRRS